MNRTCITLLLLLGVTGCADDAPKETAPLPENAAVKSDPVPLGVVTTPSEAPEPARPEDAPDAPTPAPPWPAKVTPPGSEPAPEPEWFEKEDVGVIEIIAEEDPIEQRYKEALELLELDKVEQAIALLEENARDAPEDPINHWNLASVHLALEKGEAALPPLRKAVELAPENSEYALTLAGVELVMGNAAAAEVLLGTLVKTHPEIADIHYQLGLLHIAAARVEAALAAMQEAVRLEPKHPEAWTRLAILYVEAQRWPDALAAVEGVLAAGDPDAAESVEFLHGQVLGKLKRCEDAGKALAKAREVGQAELADLAEAECWLVKSDPDRALPLLQAATARNPACQPCQMFLGDSHFIKGEWGPAADAYRAAAAASAEDWRSRRQAGKALLNLQRPAESVPLLQAAVKLADKDAEAWELLGRAYVASGNKAEAWTVMERLEGLDAADRAKIIRQLLTQ